MRNPSRKTNPHGRRTHQFAPKRTDGCGGVIGKNIAVQVTATGRPSKEGLPQGTNHAVNASMVPSGFSLL